jgi:subtilisin family serine protease
VHVTGTPDPLQGQQWALSALSAETVWAAGDATGQVVAVIDTGVDATHPDLAGVVRSGKDYLATGDGRTDPNGHGTHVAGIVGAVGGNGIGVAGLAQGAAILPVRVMDANGAGYDGDAARGIVWAADHGATVANLSFGGADPSPVMDSAIAYALGKGVTVVAASGNEGFNGDPVLWPAANPGVIAVGAVDVAGNRPGWSSSGSHLAVAAPGVAILSTVPGGYSSWSGTSMAAPYVSAAAALLKHRSALSPADVRARFMSTATDLGTPGFDSLYGAGRIDPVAAEGLLAVVDPVLAPVVTEPAPAPIVTEPAPSPSASSEPTVAPVAPVVEPSPSASASASAEPTPPAPAVVAAPVLTARISASRSRVPYGGYVTLATRTLADGLAVGGIPVRLERHVGSSWVLTRTGTTSADGLASWTLRPDRTYYYRVVGGSWTPPVGSVAVTPVVEL